MVENLSQSFNLLILSVYSKKYILADEYLVHVIEDPILQERSVSTTDCNFSSLTLFFYLMAHFNLLNLVLLSSEKCRIFLRKLEKCDFCVDINHMNQKKTLTSLNEEEIFNVYPPFIILAAIIWTPIQTMLHTVFRVQINHDLRSYENDFYLVSNMINLIILWAIMAEADNLGKREFHFYICNYI